MHETYWTAQLSSKTLNPNGPIWVHRNMSVALKWHPKYGDPQGSIQAHEDRVRSVLPNASEHVPSVVPLCPWSRPRYKHAWASHYRAASHVRPVRGPYPRYR